jgi:hypothetical protein
VIASLTVTFRGLITDVVVDRYDLDESTNGCEVEWHFEGLTPDEHDDLHVSDEEEDSIIEQIVRAMADLR